MNHNWKIYDLKRIKASGVVNTITYGCESEESGFSTRKIGELTITGSDSDPGFIPYDNLTEANVLGWLTSSIDTGSLESENSSSIAASIIAEAAVTESNGRPWEP